MNNNPLLSKNTNRNNTVPFDKIRTEHFIPAIMEQVKISENKIEKIKSNSENPSFNNTMVELEKVIEEFNSLFSIYFMLFGVESDDELKDLDEKISPMEAGFFSKLYTDDILFNRIQEVNTNYLKFNLNQEDKRLLDITYNKFVRNGALLNSDDKKKINEIDKELSTLGGKFSTNVLKLRNEYQLFITDRERLRGIPENVVKLAEETALKKGKEKGWILTLKAPCFIPVLKYAEDRELRKEILIASRKGNLGGEYDNKDNILNILRLKKERASLLGYETYSHYIVDDYMAEKPERINSFLEDLFLASLPVAKNEIDELKALANKLDSIDEFQIYDQSYYSEKLKKEKYSFDDEVLRPYFELDNVVNGVFEVANKLFDITFKKVMDIPVYHKDVRTFEVMDSESNIIGIFYLDLHPRDTKEGGAWMLSLMEQSNIEGVNKIPHVLVSCNFTPPSNETPSLLTYNEVETLFHEFGHALHGLLSDITYSSISGTNVLQDFVELPSQIMENWLPEKETLSLFAIHYKTGELIPDDLIEKLKENQKFNTGVNNLVQIRFGVLDMAWHLAEPSEIDDIVKFEGEIYNRDRLLPSVGENVSSGFNHIFHYGYSSGYYAYKWAEVLDADAFGYFKEKGIFNKEIGKLFKDTILSRGNSEHPMALYKKFRGREPKPEAFFERAGLVSV